MGIWKPFLISVFKSKLANVNEQMMCRTLTYASRLESPPRSYVVEVYLFLLQAVLLHCHTKVSHAHSYKYK